MLTVEDGTGLEDANTYASVSETDDYHALRGNAQWDELSNNAKESALVKATDYIDTRWGGRFRGSPLESGQALEFPRANLKDRYGRDITGVPDKVKKAAAEYALRAIVSDLMPDPEFDSTGARVTRRTEIVGPIEETVEYAENGVSAITRPYPAADKLLADFVTQGGRLSIG